MELRCTVLHDLSAIAELLVSLVQFKQLHSFILVINTLCRIKATYSTLKTLLRHYQQSLTKLLESNTGPLANPIKPRNVN